MGRSSFVIALVLVLGFKPSYEHEDEDEDEDEDDWLIVRLRGCTVVVKLVPVAGLEPARPCGQGILSPLRLPFRHTGKPLRHHLAQPVARVTVKNPQTAYETRGKDRRVPFPHPANLRCQLFRRRGS
jgi:hypothetical protein